MKRLSPLVLSIAGLLDLALLGLLFKVVLGRYLVLFLLGFFVLCFVVTLVAFLLFIFTVPLGPSRKD